MAEENNGAKKRIPAGLWTKCLRCEQIIYNKELEENLKVCPKCGYYFRLSARERLKQLVEGKGFQEMDPALEPSDPLQFNDVQPYPTRLTESARATGLSEAVVTGEGLIGPHRVVLGVMDFQFLGGSMGSVVGEKVTRAIERAIAKRLPLVMVVASGGARMQEGILSLMQMAKTSAAIARLREAKVPYISILTDPTFGGVTASFAMLGDIIIAEPKSLIGFAGPRVIEKTIKQQLPEGFQRAEFLLEHGMIDMIVERKRLREALIRTLSFF